MRYWIYSSVYVIAILLLSAISLHGQVDKYNCNTYVPSINDRCEDAILFSGTLEGVTCCGSIGQIDLCGDMETSVWYIYDQALEGTVLDFTNLDISGPVGIEIYSGDCDNLALIDRADCSGLTQSSFTVPNCSGRLYIHVSSKDQGCGAFLMSAMDISGCNAAEDCEDLGPEHTFFPISDAGQVCLSSCLELSCNSECTNQSVWFEMQTDNVATAMNVSVENADFDVLLNIRRIGTNCNDGTDLVTCYPLAEGEVLEVDVTQDVIYFIEVSLAGGVPSAFDLCVNTIQQNIDCANASLQVIRRDFPGANPNGPFCPGETVTFCYDLEFFVDARGSGNNCQWLQGIVPVLGGGWDLSANDISGNIPAGWAYWPEGTVDFNVDHPTIAPTNDPLNRISLEYGPGGLSEGDLLPAGWWIVSNGNDAGCVNDGDPDNGWGFELPCDDIYYFTHCFDLTTRSVTDIQDCDDDFGRDLSVNVFVFADGQTGCYDNSTCTGDVPASFEGVLDCSILLDIVVNDTEICSGEFVDLDITLDGGYESAVSVEVIDASNTSGASDRIFETGNGILPDQIINTTGAVQTVRYSATLYNPESDCPVPTVFFNVTVQPELEVSVVTTEFTACNEMSSQAPSCIDLTTFTSTQGGVWNRPSEYLGDFSDITNVCFEGIAAGTELTFTFTTNNAQRPCDETQASIVIKVINCDCPNLSLENPLPLCTEGGSLDLTSLETAQTVSGSWTFDDGPETIVVAADNMLDAEGRAVGIYTFRFTPDVTPDVSCDQFNTIEVQVFSPLSAGTGNVIDFCENEIEIVNLNSLLDNADPGGSWEETSLSLSHNGFDSDAGVFDISNEAPGIYEFIYFHIASVICPSVASKVIVVINANPVADAGADFELTCAQNTIQLGGPSMEIGPRIEYSWEELGRQQIPNAQTSNPIVTQPGIYTVRLFDNLLGCESFDTVTISEDRSIPTFNAEVKPVSCDGSELGGIIISNSTGGNGDYSYSIDDGATWSDRTIFDNLQAGTYNVLIEDGNGCQSSVKGLVVPEPIFIGLDIGEDQEVQFGDATITLSLNTIASAEDISIVVWEDNGEIICEGGHNDCVEIDVDPTGVSTYCVTVSDNNGCQETACVVITEVLDPNVYMANVFTPERSSFNNRIFVQTDENIELVQEFVIFDKWGEKVFVGTPDHLPNDPYEGWDGMFNDDMAPSGIYTYMVKVLDVLGETRIISGNVTLLK